MSDQYSTLANVRSDAFATADMDVLGAPLRSAHRPRILMLYGSVRQRSYSRFLTQEAARLLERLGAEVRIFDPSGLPLPDNAPDDHPRVRELRDLVAWSEGQVWTSPERHGAMSGILKAQIDWIPLNEAGRMRPSAYYDRIVDVMEELVKFTLLTRDVSHHLTDRYSERVETAAALSARVNLTAATQPTPPPASPAPHTAAD